MNRGDAMVFLRAVLIALFVSLSAAAMAADRPDKPSAWFCMQARAHRALFASDKAAEDAARALGATQATIDKAHRCKR